MKEELKRKLIFIFKEEQYEIEFPTVGQYLDIENEKLFYSQGNWGKLIASFAKSSYRAVQVIECIANLKILCPRLFENMKLNVLQIDMKDFAELVVFYNKNIKPWYSSWFKEFNEIFKEEEDLEKKEED